MPVSNSDRSMCCPSPVLSRSRSAARMPVTASVPVSRSMDRGARLRRRAVGLAGDAHQPDHPLQGGVDARLVCAGSRVAVAGYRGVDDARVYPVDAGIVETVPREVAGLEVLDDDVGLRRHALHETLAARLLEVHANALLAPVDGEEVGRLGLHEGRPETARVVSAGRLDLPDGRAEVGEYLRRERAGEHARQVEDLQVSKSLHVLYILRLKWRTATPGRLRSVDPSERADGNHSAITGPHLVYFGLCPARTQL